MINKKNKRGKLEPETGCWRTGVVVLVETEHFVRVLLGKDDLLEPLTHL